MAGKLCYIIMAHTRPDRVASLIRSLRGENVCFAVHYDAGSGDDLSSFSAMENVDLVAPRIAVRWGEMSQIDALVASCRTALRSGADYFVLLSGMDRPLKSAEQIRDRLLSDRDTDRIEGTPFPGEDCGWPEGGRRRVAAYALPLGGRRIATIEPRRIDPGNLRQLAKSLFFGSRFREALRLLFAPPRPAPPVAQLYGGEFWWRLGRKTLGGIIGLHDSDPSLYSWLRHTNNPDEVYFNTLARMAGGKFDDDILTLINWRGGSSPAMFTTADRERLEPAAAGSDMLFARKIADDALPFIPPEEKL